LKEGINIPIKDQWPEPSQGRQKGEGQRKAKRQPAHRNQKKGRELVPLVIGSYLTHGLSNVTCVEKGINQPTTR
jgi:hypothetical protein